MVASNLVYRGQKPVFWSPSSATALAEAELEYEDNHVSPSVYVGFSLASLPQALSGEWSIKAGEIKAVIWTTTPWTLPGNRAIAFNPDATYVLARPSSSSPSAASLPALVRVPLRRGGALTH